MAVNNNINSAFINNTIPNGTNNVFYIATLLNIYISFDPEVHGKAWGLFIAAQSNGPDLTSADMHDLLQT